MGSMHLWNNCNIGNAYNKNASDPLCKAAANSHLAQTATTKTPETKTPKVHSVCANLKWIYKVLPNCPGYLFSLVKENLSVQLSSGILASSLLSLLKYLDTK